MRFFLFAVAWCVIVEMFGSAQLHAQTRNDKQAPLVAADVGPPRHIDLPETRGNSALVRSDVARVNFVAVALDAESYSIQLPTGDSINLRRTWSKPTSGGVVWYGTIDTPNLLGESGSALFSLGTSAAAGWIRTPSRHWKLIPRGRGQHYLLEMDVSKYQDVNDQAFVARGTGESRPAEMYSFTQIPISTLVVFDTRLGIPNGQAAWHRAQLHVESFNVALSNSDGGNMTMYLDFANYTWMNVNSNFTPSQHAQLSSDANVAWWRDNSSADIVVLESYAEGTVCGVAPLMPSASEAFAVAAANLPCDYTFAHEVGHLLSGDHNPENENPLNPKQYAHDFYRVYPGGIDEPDYVTLMTTKSSTNCPGNLCERLHQFANPNQLDWLGYQMGTFANHDNLRAMREEAARLAAFR